MTSSNPKLVTDFFYSVLDEFISTPLTTPPTPGRTRTKERITQSYNINPIVKSEEDIFDSWWYTFKWEDENILPGESLKLINDSFHKNHSIFSDPEDEKLPDKYGKTSKSFFGSNFLIPKDEPMDIKTENNESSSIFDNLNPVPSIKVSIKKEIFNTFDKCEYSSAFNDIVERIKSENYDLDLNREIKNEDIKEELRDFDLVKTEEAINDHRAKIPSLPIIPDSSDDDSSDSGSSIGSSRTLWKPNEKFKDFPRNKNARKASHATMERTDSNNKSKDFKISKKTSPHQQVPDIAIKYDLKRKVTSRSRLLSSSSHFKFNIPSGYKKIKIQPRGPNRGRFSKLIYSKHHGLFTRVTFIVPHRVEVVDTDDECEYEEYPTFIRNVLPGEPSSPCDSKLSQNEPISKPSRKPYKKKTLKIREFGKGKGKGKW